MDLSLSQNFFDLDMYFSKRRVLRASKRDLEREISTTVDRDWIFFLAEVSKYKASRWSIFSRLSISKIQPRVIHSFNHNSSSFLQSNETIQAFLRNYFKELWSFDLLITALVLILDISCLTRLLRESSCHANRWTDIRNYFGPSSHVSETQGFVQQKKNERQEETFKKVKSHANKSVSSR